MQKPQSSCTESIGDDKFKTPRCNQPSGRKSKHSESKNCCCRRCKKQKQLLEQSCNRADDCKLRQFTCCEGCCENESTTKRSSEASSIVPKGKSDQCPCLYTKLLGPTADESILSVLQTLLSACQTCSCTLIAMTPKSSENSTINNCVVQNGLQELESCKKKLNSLKKQLGKAGISHSCPGTSRNMDYLSKEDRSDCSSVTDSICGNISVASIQTENVCNCNQTQTELAGATDCECQTIVCKNSDSQVQTLIQQEEEKPIVFEPQYIPREESELKLELESSESSEKSAETVKECFPSDSDSDAICCPTNGKLNFNVCSGKRKIVKPTLSGLDKCEMLAWGHAACLPLKIGLTETKRRSAKGECSKSKKGRIRQLFRRKTSVNSVRRVTNFKPSTHKPEPKKESQSKGEFSGRKSKKGPVLEEKEVELEVQNITSEKGKGVEAAKASKKSGLFPQYFKLFHVSEERDEKEILNKLIHLENMNQEQSVSNSEKEVFCSSFRCLKAESNMETESCINKENCNCEEVGLQITCEERSKCIGSFKKESSDIMCQCDEREKNRKRYTCSSVDANKNKTEITNSSCQCEDKTLVNCAIEAGCDTKIKSVQCEEECKSDAGNQIEKEENNYCVEKRKALTRCHSELNNKSLEIEAGCGDLIVDTKCGAIVNTGCGGFPVDTGCGSFWMDNINSEPPDCNGTKKKKTCYIKS